MDEPVGSGEEQRVRHVGQSSRSVDSGSKTGLAEIPQLLQGLLVAVLSVGMLLGGFLLSQLDIPGEPSPPTQQIAGRSTLTPFLPTFTPQPVSTMPGTEPGPTATPEGVMADTATPEGGLAVTATPTVAPSEPAAQPPVCTRPPGWIIYTVRTGDTLSRLAQQAGATTPALMQGNCRSTSALIPGEHIYLPAAFYASPTPEPYLCGPPWSWVVYIVRPGDTLYSLSRRYGVDVESIRRANCLDSYAIYSGQALYVPPLPPTPWPTATATPFPSATPTPWSSPTPWPTATPTGTPKPTPTTAPTLVTTTPSATATWTPTSTPSPVPETPAPTSTSTVTPTPLPTSTPTTMPTSTPAAPPTATFTSAPTSTPTALPSPTPLPTSTPTELPTATPTPSTAASG